MPACVTRDAGVTHARVGCDLRWMGGQAQGLCIVRGDGDGDEPLAWTWPPRAIASR